MIKVLKMKGEKGEKGEKGWKDETMGEGEDKRRKVGKD